MRQLPGAGGGGGAPGGAGGAGTLTGGGGGTLVLVSPLDITDAVDSPTLASSGRLPVFTRC